MPEDTKQPLVLVDGSSYLFRAFHALPPLVSSRGHPTGAVKGVISMIRSLIKNYPDSHIAIVFDAKGKTFRNEIYADYKAHRPPMPDELRVQIQPIHEIVRAMGLPLLIIEGVEADDVIGTLATQANEKGIETVVSTGDKDLAQLVSPHVTLINTMTSEVLDEQGVKNKFGVTPAQFIDYLALVGDKADNIPGVPGVGPKTAVKWLEEYQSMEGIIANAEQIKGKIGEKLRDNIDLLRLSYHLATIKRDVALDIPIDGLIPDKEDSQELHRLFSELEFKTWITELESQGVEGPLDQQSQTGSVGSLDIEKLKVPEVIEYRTVLSEPELDELLARLEQAERFAFEIQHDGGHFLDSQIIGIAFSCESGKAWYIPLGHTGETGGEQLDRDATLKKLKPLLESRRKAKVGYDLKNDAHVLANYEIELAPFKSDILLASYVLNSVAIKHQLPEMVKYYLDQNPTDLDALLGKGRGKLTLSQLPFEEATRFAAENADMILRLATLLEHELETTGHLAGLYRYYELPLIHVLQKMEREGIRVDAAVLQQQSAELGARLQELEQEVYNLAGEEFNLGSPKQLQQIFYEKLELPVISKTKTGQPSTAEPVLQELAADYELPRLILEHRSLSKLKSTYTDKLPLQINAGTGRIHSSFQQAVAATGRLSSTEPNLQNIPIRTAEGRRIRKAFVCQPGYKLLAADYSQVELRIMAHLSQDPGLLKAFADSLDVHTATAAEVFETKLEDVTAEQRRRAKAINFGLIYGMSAFGLANQLGIGRQEAQQYVERYFERYPGVRQYMDQTQALADEKGYVETLFGRRLYLPDIRAGNAVLRRAAQRTAINAPMQGTAADIIKHAMIDIDHWLAVAGLDARMLLQVHDELIFEVATEDVELLADGVRFRMVTAASLDVPLVVDVGTGDNWDKAH
ncbi:MAG: DNA polymerase I [Gammaproteobacteria bacterium]|jgi:DNA polymerase-1